MVKPWGVLSSIMYYSADSRLQCIGIVGKHRFCSFPQATYGSGDPTKRRKYLGLHRFPFRSLIQISSAWLISGRSFHLSHLSLIVIVSGALGGCISSRKCDAVVWYLAVLLQFIALSAFSSSSDFFEAIFHCSHDMCKAYSD